MGNGRVLQKNVLNFLHAPLQHKRKHINAERSGITQLKIYPEITLILCYDAARIWSSSLPSFLCHQIVVCRLLPIFIFLCGHKSFTHTHAHTEMHFKPRQNIITFGKKKRTHHDPIGQICVVLWSG